MVDFKEMSRDQKSYNNILVMVYRLAKLLWSIPYIKNVIVRNVARIYYNNPFHIFKLPEKVISNQRP